MAKSPFEQNFIKVCFVHGPTGEQHIFEVKTGGRADRSMCGKTAGEIHSTSGYADVNESKERLLEKPVCVTCQKKWKAHPRSPWKMWQSTAKKVRA